MAMTMLVIRARTSSTRETEALLQDVFQADDEVLSA